MPALGADQRQPWGDGHWWLGLSPQFPRYPLDPLARSRVNLEASGLSFAVVVERWTLLRRAYADISFTFPTVIKSSTVIFNPSSESKERFLFVPHAPQMFLA